MGNSVSGILSSIYMDAIEQRSLHHLNIGLYKRYVDDIFLLTTSEEEARTIHRQLIGQDSNIKFEIELPEEKTISLLDFTVNMETGTPTFSFYRKEARKPVFINYESAIPTQAKVTVIQNERNRISGRCSSEETKQRSFEAFDNTLKMNGYPESFITNTHKGPRKSRRKSKATSGDFVYLQFPFLSDSLHHRVQNIFRRNDLPVRVFDKNVTLRSSLCKPAKPPDCLLENCSISNSKICFIKRCVYEMRCDKCRATYIGSTLRTLHIRAREHLTSEQSSVFQHRQLCGGKFDVTVLARARDNTSLRFKEALIIKRNSPAINQKRESDELLNLTFA